MKKTLLVTIAILTILHYDAYPRNAKNNVPQSVLSSFSQRYLKVSAQKWNIKHDTCVAKFTMDGRKRRAYYLSNGDWIKTETKLPWSWDMPKDVQKSWNKSQFASWYIEEIHQIESPGNNTYVIQVHFDYGPPGAIPGDCWEIVRLYFNPQGDLVKKERID